jgi:hypothetical protein
MMSIRRTSLALGPEPSRGMIMVGHEDDVMDPANGGISSAVRLSSRP